MEQQKYKWSNYSFLINIDSGILMYNSTTGEVIRFKETKYIDFIEKIKDESIIDINNFSNEENEIIKMFAERRILVNSDLDELSLLTYSFNNIILNNNMLELTLIVTRQCNYRCVYCYEEHLDLPMQEEVYQSILKLLENVFATCQYNGVSISLFGGEPLLEYEHLIDFLKKAYNIAEKYNKKFQVGATTNGSLLFPERFLELYDVNCRHYQITLDGLSHTHDTYRLSTDGNGWHKIVENLKYMASTDKDFDVTIRTNFNEEILNDIDSFYNFLEKTFDSRFNIYYEGIKNLGGENDEYVDVLDTVSANISAIEITNLIKKHNLKSNVCTERIMPFSHICQATKPNSYIIDYDGKLLKCTLDFNEPKNQIGYLTNDGELYVSHEKHCKWVTCGYETNDQCKRCKLLPICYGRSCVSGSIETKKIYCDGETETMFLIEQIKNYYK